MAFLKDHSWCNQNRKCGCGGQSQYGIFWQLFLKNCSNTDLLICRIIFAIALYCDMILQLRNIVTRLKEMLSNTKRHKFGFIIGLLSTAFSNPHAVLCLKQNARISATPMKGTNRGAFAFNMGLDTHVLEPTASAYKNTMPKTGQRAIENHLNWAGLPATTFNSALQGRYENASVAFLHLRSMG